MFASNLTNMQNKIPEACAEGSILLDPGEQALVNKKKIHC